MVGLVKFTKSSHAYDHLYQPCSNQLFPATITVTAGMGRTSLQWISVFSMLMDFSLSYEIFCRALLTNYVRAPRTQRRAHDEPPIRTPMGACRRQYRGEPLLPTARIQVGANRPQSDIAQRARFLRICFVICLRLCPCNSSSQLSCAGL